MATLSSAESNRASIRYIKEAVWGTTPGSGTTREFRLTGSSLAASKQTKVSDELRADRMVANIVEVGAKSGGDLKWELSAFTHDDMFESFLCGAWTSAQKGLVVRGSTVTVTGSSQITLTGADYRNWLTSGQVIKLEGFSTLANNGYFTMSGAASYSGGNTVITTVESSLTIESGSSYTKLVDANDVISKATTTQFGASNTVTITGSFRQAPVVGQRLWIEGLGKETGTVQSLVTDPAEGDTITVSDGVASIVFEVRTDLTLIGANSVGVSLSGTPATMATNLKNAINDQFRQEKLRVSASSSTDTVTLTNHRLTGGSITTSDVSAFTVVNFSGGSATKGGFYTVASVPGSTSFTTVETLSTDTNAGSKTVVIKGAHLRNPGSASSIVKQSYTIETGFTDVAKFFTQRGMRPGSFSMNVASGAIVTGDFGFSGRDTVVGTATALGNAGSYSVLPTTATEVLNATANVGAVLKNGAALSTAIKSITMKGDAKLREQEAVGSKFPAGIAYGRFTLSGKIEAYFNDLSFYNNFLNHDTVSLAFSFEDRDHMSYYFTIPAAKIKTDPIAPGKIDEDVMEEMEWEAQRDSTLNTQFMIDRFSSVYPTSVV
jgi:hypothetical protein